MIRNRLASILADRNIKITKVAKDTGISRNTITATAQNDGKMIQLETINSLCRYLAINPGDFFEYIPFDIIPVVYVESSDYIFSNNGYDEELHENKLSVYSVLDIYLEVYEESGTKKTFDLTAKLNKYSDNLYDIIEDRYGNTSERLSVKVDYEINFVDKEDAQLFKNRYWDKMSYPFQEEFLVKLALNISKTLKANIKEEIIDDNSSSATNKAHAQLIADGAFKFSFTSESDFFNR